MNAIFSRTEALNKPVAIYLLARETVIQEYSPKLFVCLKLNEKNVRKNYSNMFVKFMLCLHLWKFSLVGSPKI